MGFDERLQVLAGLARRDGEEIGRAEVGTRTVGAERVLGSRVPDVDTVGGHSERLRHVPSRVLRVHEHDVARRGGVPVFARVHRARARGDPLRVTQRNEIVNGRRADAASLWWVHPVAEVEHVEHAEQPLRGGSSSDAPARAQRVREGEPDRPELDVETGERGADPLRPFDARRRERDDLVLPGGSLGQAAQRPPDVVPDPEQRVRERRHVEDDPHEAGS
jgi:hypothetical protein